MRVIIVGAGIGGLTTAIALRRRNIDVEVYERAPRLTEVGAGVSLWPNALKALYQLGMKPALDAMSFVSESGALRRKDGRFVSRTSASEFVRRFGMATTVFHRAELLDALVRAAKGIPIHLGRECRDFEQSGDRVTVHFADRTQASADALVGADGVRSIVRERLGIAGALQYAGYTAWRSIAPFDTRNLVAGETFGCGQRFGLVPIAGNRLYWYATDNLLKADVKSHAPRSSGCLTFSGIGTHRSRTSSPQQTRTGSCATTSTIATRWRDGAKGTSRWSGTPRTR